MNTTPNVLYVVCDCNEYKAMNLDELLKSVGFVTTNPATARIKIEERPTVTHFTEWKQVMPADFDEYTTDLWESNIGELECAYKCEEVGYVIFKLTTGQYWTIAIREDHLGTFEECVKLLEENL